MLALTTLDHCNSGPLPWHELIALDLRDRFPDLISGTSPDNAGESVQRLLCFLGSLGSSFERGSALEQQAGSRKSSTPLLSMSDVLTILPGRSTSAAVVDLYLTWMASVLGIAVCTAERSGVSTGGADLHIRSSCAAQSPAAQAQEAGKILLLTTGVASKILEWDDDPSEFQSEFERLRQLIGSYDTHVWAIGEGHSYSSLRVSKETEESVQKRVGRLLDPTDSKARLVHQLYHAYMHHVYAKEEFVERSDDGLQTLINADRRDNVGAGLNSVFHVFLNIAMQLSGARLPVDSGIRELSASTLRCHFFCVMVQDHQKCAVDTLHSLHLDGEYAKWFADNPLPVCAPAQYVTSVFSVFT